jgi:Ca2+/H+ antiporter
VAAHQSTPILRQDLDSDGDGLITFDEMKGGLKRWLAELKADHKKAGSAEEGTKAWETPSPNTPLLPNAGGDIEEQEGDDDDDEEEGEEELTPQQIMRKAAMLLLGGTALVGLFSDPMVDAVSSFSEYSGIPAFFVSFVITPFASNASELVSSLQFAKKRRVKNISLTYSQVYGAVTMNNTMCLGLFLFIVWLRGLDWTFSSEVVTTMASIFALGAVAASRQTFQLYWAAVSFALYPVALALVWFLDYEIGWK